MAREYMRRVRFAPYRRGCGPSFTLTLWDYFRPPGGLQDRLRYTLTMRENGRTCVLFDGDDFNFPRVIHTAYDGDNTVRSLMLFLTLRPGDTDADYFADYTSAQLAFCDEHAEYLALEVTSRFGEG